MMFLAGVRLWKFLAVGAAAGVAVCARAGIALTRSRLATSKETGDTRHRRIERS